MCLTNPSPFPGKVPYRNIFCWIPWFHGRGIREDVDDVLEGRRRQCCWCRDVPPRRLDPISRFLETSEGCVKRLLLVPIIAIDRGFHVGRIHHSQSDNAQEQQRKQRDDHCHSALVPLRIHFHFSPHWQLVLKPIPACEQLFSLTVVTNVAVGLCRVWGSAVAACRVSLACTVSTVARLEPTAGLTGNPTTVPLVYAEKISVFRTPCTST